MFNYADPFSWARTYQENALRTAEKERLIRLALAGREKRPDLFRRALARIGQLLIAWGCILQERYGHEAGPPLPPMLSSPGKLSGP